MYAYRTLIGAFLSVVCAAASSAQAGEFPIAGTTPWERPVGAPVVQTYQKGPDWYQLALTGVTRPYPASLRFLEDQGAWHTPFNRPGMPGRYDIRGWYGH